MSANRRARNVWALLAEPRSVVLILIVYCAVHLIVRLLLSPNYTLDESEQMLFSQSLQWGYRFRHPPLITWLSWLTLEGSGQSRAAFFLLKYALMGAGLAAYFAAARIVIGDVRLAALATFALLTTVVMGYLPNIDLMHTVLLATMIAAFLWAAARVLTSGTNNDYMLLGLFTGLGILSKYIFLVLPVAMAIAVVMTPQFRARIRLRPFLGALLLVTVIIGPYVWWAVSHEYSLFALAKTITKSAGPAVDPLGWLKGAGDLVIAIVGFAIPALVLGPILYWRACFPLQGGTDDERAWLRVLGITMLAATAIMLCAVFFIGPEEFKPRWMHQVVMPLFIWFFLRVKLTGGYERANKIFAALVLVFALGVVGARITIYETHADDCKTCREYWPMTSYARAFRMAGFTDGTVVAATYDLGGNLRPVLHGARVVTPGYPPSVFGAPRGGQCLIVWEGRGDLPGEVTAYLNETLGARVTEDAPRGTVEARLVTSDGRLAAMRYILMPGKGACR